jgi:hypothetical protein
MGNHKQHTYRYLDVLLCASAAWLSKYLAEKKKFGVQVVNKCILLFVFFYVFLSRALWYTYVIRTNKIHTVIIKDLIQLNCLRHVATAPSFHPQEDLYTQFYGISFMRPYKQCGRRQDVLDIKHILLIWMHERNAIKLRVQIFLRMNTWFVRNMSKTI